jgi:hypothetical protein
VLRKFQVNIRNLSSLSRRVKKIYKFNTGVILIIDRKRPRMKKFKWLHGSRFGRPVAKVHLHKRKLWYNQKKNCLLKNLLITKNKIINNITLKKKIKLTEYCLLEN